MVSSNIRTALVTGASRGIGAAIAQRLAADGLAVVLNYAGNLVGAEEAAGRIQAAGGNACAVPGDLSDARQVSTLFDEATASFGGIDILVNNAGVMQLATLAEASDELFDHTVAINLRGVFNCMREAARRLRAGGRVVSLSSSVVGLYRPTYGVYAATKAGVEAMTRVMAGEMRGRRITVNAVAPGPTAAMSPLERLGMPEDIASVVSFLVGPDGAWINGQVLRANGGIV